MDTNEVKSILQSYIGQKKNELLALQFIEDLFTNGYQTDQARIDAEIQAGKDAVAAQIAGKDTQIATLTAQVTNLTTENTALKTPVEPPVEVIV